MQRLYCVQAACKGKAGHRTPKIHQMFFSYL